MLVIHPEENRIGARSVAFYLLTLRILFMDTQTLQELFQRMDLISHGEASRKESTITAIQIEHVDFHSLDSVLFGTKHDVFDDVFHSKDIIHPKKSFVKKIINLFYKKERAGK